MKKKSKKEEFDYAMLFNSFIYSMGIYFGAIAIKSIILIPFQEFPRLIDKAILLIPYACVFIFSIYALDSPKFKKYVIIASLILLTSAVIGNILYYVI